MANIEVNLHNSAQYANLKVFTIFSRAALYGGDSCVVGLRDHYLSDELHI